MALVVALPVLGGQLLHHRADALGISVVSEVGSEGAAAGLGAGVIDAGAARAEDARPARGQPGEVTAEDLGLIFGIGELDVRTRESQLDLRHLDNSRRRASAGFALP